MPKRLGVQPEPCRDCFHAPRIRTADPGSELDQLPDRHLQRRRQLRHEADLAQHLATVLARVQIIDADLALTDIFPEQTADQRGLAGPVGADQGDAMSALDGEVDALQNGLATKAFADLLETDHRAFSSPLNLKLSELVGQTSTQRPQRVQSAPMSVVSPVARPRMVTSSTCGTMQIFRQSPSW